MCGSRTASILIVDDDADIRESLGELLESEGYYVAWVGSGEEALQYLRTSAHPRLILLDLMMPRLDGTEFRRIQLADPSLAGIPVVLVSAAANARGQQEPLRAAAVLEKPFEVDALLSTVARLCA